MSLPEKPGFFKDNLYRDALEIHHLHDSKADTMVDDTTCQTMSPIRLAESGFYYDEEGDKILCFSCGFEKRYWDREKQEHKDQETVSGAGFAESFYGTGDRVMTPG
nr:hypothetical protein BaRGS_025523 [Batillaria attramentaria]